MKAQWNTAQTRTSQFLGCKVFSSIINLSQSRQTSQIYLPTNQKLHFCNCLTEWIFLSVSPFRGLTGSIGRHRRSLQVPKPEWVHRDFCSPWLRSRLLMQAVQGNHVSLETQCPWSPQSEILGSSASCRGSRKHPPLAKTQFTRDHREVVSCLDLSESLSKLKYF